MRHAYIVGLSLAATLIVVIATTGPAWGFDGPITEYPIPTGESEPTSIAPGPDGAMWFTEAAGDKVGRISSTGKITEYVLPTADAEPNGIVTGADGDLWFTETHANKIGKLVPSTGQVTEYSIPTANSQPTGIALGAEGDVWFTEYATSKVARITPAGTVEEYGTLFGDDNPLYITPSAGEGASMWYSGDKGRHIGYVNASGTAGEATAPKEQDPTGIAIGSDGATWFSTFEAESGASTLDRLPGLFGALTETEQFNLNLGQLLADSDLGFWYVSDTGGGASLYRVTSDNVVTDEAKGPVPAHTSDCYSKTNLRACPLDGLAFGPNRAIWFTDFSTNSIGMFPTGYAPLPEVSGPAGPEGKAGAEGKAGPEGKAGTSGVAGAEGKAGPAGVNASTIIVIVPFQTTVTASSVTVHYALTAAAKITLSVTATAGAKTATKGASGNPARKAGGTAKGAVIVATSNGKVGSDTIKWNRKLSGKYAKAGTYTLTLQASTGTAQAKAAEKVRLSSH
jgi:streptogramin lyase